MSQIFSRAGRPAGFTEESCPRDDDLGPWRWSHLRGDLCGFPRRPQGRSRSWLESEPLWTWRALTSVHCSPFTVHSLTWGGPPRPSLPSREVSHTPRGRPCPGASRRANDIREVAALGSLPREERGLSSVWGRSANGQGLPRYSHASFTASRRAIFARVLVSLCLEPSPRARRQSSAQGRFWGSQTVESKILAMTTRGNNVSRRRDTWLVARRPVLVPRQKPRFAPGNQDSWVSQKCGEASPAKGRKG